MNNELLIKALVDEYSTPLYLYDLNVARARASELHAVLPVGAKLHYSFKSNPLPSLARVMEESGCCADVTSVGELTNAQEAGFDLAHALYGGPGITSGEVMKALQLGVRHFSCESFCILKRIAEAAKVMNIRPRVLLRVNPAEPPKAKLAMTGVSSQFGFEEADLIEAGSDALKVFRDAVDFIGVHIYFGSQIGNAEMIAECTDAALLAAQRVSRAVGLELQVINVGGGFPWPYAVDGKGADVAPLKGLLTEVLEKHSELLSCTLWFESGRYLSSSSGTLVARVMDTKLSKGRQYLILDTGIHHLGGMSGLGRIPRPVVSLHPLGNSYEGVDPITVDVVGPLCSPLDTLARNLKVPPLQPGDLVTIPNVGAYGISASLSAFLSRPTPIEITLREGKVEAVYQLNWGHSRKT